MPGHEGLAGVARGHRGFGRTDHARPLLRCARRPGRLRQVPARHDDGDGAAQCAVDLHLWRLDPAGHDSKASPSRCRTSSRRSANIRVGEMSTRICDELEMRGLPFSRRLRRPIHRQYDGDCVSEAIGLALPYSAGAPAPYEIRDRFCMTAGEMVMELHRPQHPSARYRHPQGSGECRDGRRRLRRFDQCRAAPAGDRA